MNEREIAERLAEHMRRLAPQVSEGPVKHYCKGCGDPCLVDLWAITLGICGPCCNRIAAALESKPAEEGR